MPLIPRSAALAIAFFAACLPAFFSENSLAQSAGAFQSPSVGTVLAAVMPETAHAGWWVLPAEPSWFAKGFSGNLLVIEQRWSLQPGVSVGADCTVASPLGEVAELLPLEALEGSGASFSFLNSTGVKSISLRTKLPSGGKPLASLRALLLAHSDPLRDPILVHIRLVAF